MQFWAPADRRHLCRLFAKFSEPIKTNEKSFGHRLYMFVVALGMPPVRFIVELGHIVLFIGRILYWMPRRPYRWSELLRLCRDVGFGALFIVCMTGFLYRS